ncbi:hypothetical protein ACFVVM_16660 [Nocardia sp. NPDC058176]|uniref:hypothetical protein n=1 Tax=Nocardia sp. NPDC058176 TaxID=3346368 RepID=UPI0036DAC61E
MNTTTGHRTLIRDGNELRLQSAPRPDASHPGPVRRVLRVGVCGTDLQIQRGARADLASILGHEGIALTPDEQGCEIFNPVDPRAQDVILGHSYDGLLRDHVPARLPCGMVPAHPDLPLDLGPLVEPTATALYAWDLMRVHLPLTGTVAVFGGGSAALLVAMLGEDLGYRMQLVHPRRGRLDYLDQLGVLPDSTLTQRIQPASVHGALVCLPREATVTAINAATASLTDTGVLDLFGGIPAGLRHPALPGIDLSAVRRANVCGRSSGYDSVQVFPSAGKRIWVTGHRGTSPAHLDRAQQHLLAAPHRFGTLISHVISLEEAASRIPAMARGERPVGEHVKVVVDLTMSRPAREPDLAITVADHLEALR